ncbi:MAG: DUF1801 domain-containing protein [Candidatus Pacebacteria bacterium]|nr:DUF1801 domain-containing protein [Candidatus Paceibacterota bacterium]
MAKPQDIDSYLKTVPETHRAALVQLRGQIKKLYPKATEHIGYGMPLIKLNGHPLLSFHAAKTHNSIFPWSSSTTQSLKAMLKSYSTGKGTVRFEPHKPLPLKIVKAVLKEREKEINKRWPAKVKKK